MKIVLRGKYGKDKFAIVDDDMFEYLNQWKWCVDTGYAIHTLNKPYKKILMHRLIMGAKRGQETDHINGNRLDNRRKNLRIVTSQQNKWNSGISKNKKVAFKGVSYKKDHRKYVASLTYNQKWIFLGYFNTPEEAARAYDDGAKRYFREYARLNFRGGDVDL